MGALRRSRCACSLLCVPATAGAAKAKKKIKTASVPVTFTVKNTDTSQFACPSDGATYQVKGHLTGPASALAASSKKKKKKRPKGVDALSPRPRARRVAVGLQAVPSYNYAPSRRRPGHVSVTVDRLGYGASGQPPDGNQSCIGSQADVAHQIVQAPQDRLLRGRDRQAGQVQAGRAGRPLRRRRDLDPRGLLVQGRERSGRGRVLVLEPAGREHRLRQPAQRRAAGGEPAGPGLPASYASSARRRAEFQQTLFHSATKAVRDAATAAPLPRPVRRQPLADRRDQPAGGRRAQDQGSGARGLRRERRRSTRRSAATPRRSASRARTSGRSIIKNAGHGAAAREARGEVPQEARRLALD